MDTSGNDFGIEIPSWPGHIWEPILKLRIIGLISNSVRLFVP
jgi:hypothetical protein